jgi:sugar phosphate isomerase/epimerase
MDLPRAEPFVPANRAATRRRLGEAGLAVCCVSSSGVVAKGNVDHVKAHAELARDLGAPLVRVFGGNLPDDVPHQEAVAGAAETLRAFGDAAQAEGVSIVLETHDAFSTGVQVAELLAVTAHPAVFALWDLHHPYTQGEPIEETHRLLAPRIRYVHVKDGRDGVCTLLGEGDVPIFAMLDLIRGGGYDGPISVEWEKRWQPQIADPEIALPQYANALRAYLSGSA